jgi:hypothetical protein
VQFDADAIARAIILHKIKKIAEEALYFDCLIVFKTQSQFHKRRKIIQIQNQFILLFL